MKKTLLIITLLIGLGNLNAQDSTNDATWEETIDFINTKKDYFNFSGEKSSITISGEAIIVTIYSHGLFISRNGEPNKWEKEVTHIPFKYLNEVSMDDTYIILSFTGDYVTVKEFWAEDNNFIKDDAKGSTYQLKTQRNYQRTGYHINDTEMRKRLTKAFQHLAYLATKKRKAEVKASGDKF